MKTKLNILCFLLLIAFAGCMYNAFLGGMEGASDASRGDIGNKLQPLFYAWAYISAKMASNRADRNMLQGICTLSTWYPDNWMLWVAMS